LSRFFSFSVLSSSLSLSLLEDEEAEDNFFLVGSYSSPLLSLSPQALPPRLAPASPSLSLLLPSPSLLLLLLLSSLASTSELPLLLMTTTSADPGPPSEAAALLLFCVRCCGGGFSCRCVLCRCRCFCCLSFSACLPAATAVSSSFSPAFSPAFSTLTSSSSSEDESEDVLSLLLSLPLLEALSPMSSASEQQPMQCRATLLTAVRLCTLWVHAGKPQNTAPRLSTPPTPARSYIHSINPIHCHQPPIYPPDSENSL
jgi:hypothetical protein